MIDTEWISSEDGKDGNYDDQLFQELDLCVTLMLPELPKLRSESLLCRIGIGQDDERERVCGEDILVQYFNISIFMYIYLRRAHLEL